MPTKIERCMDTLMDRRQEPLVRLKAVYTLEDELDRICDKIIAEARKAHTWREIGDVFGISRQGAQSRFKR